MNKQRCQLQGMSRSWRRVRLLLPVAVLLGVGSAGAQAAAEYAAATSVAGGVGAGTKAPKTIASPPKKKRKAKFLHLPACTDEVNEEANRRALEAGAGEDGTKLLLRSLPDKALVWVDGKRIGRTPLLLVLAPGQYTLEMRGRRKAFARRQLEITAKDKQELVLPLASRYPTQVRLH